MADTIHNRLKAALEAKGWVRDTQARTMKYTTMKRAAPKTEKGVRQRLYIGVSGALRHSPTGAVTTAYPVNTLKAELLGETPKKVAS